MTLWNIPAEVPYMRAPGAGSSNGANDWPATARAGVWA